MQHIYQCLDQVMDYARSHAVEHIVIPGDIFDKPFPSQESVSEFVRYINKHKLFKFYIIPGNHDKEGDALSFHVLFDFMQQSILTLDNLKIFVEPTVHKIAGIEHYFMPWPHKKPKRGMVNVAHISKSGFVSDNGRKIKDDEGVETDNHIWIIGHLHRRQSGRQTHYPGTLYQGTFGEPLPKGFLHARLEKTLNLKVSVRFIPVDPPFKLFNVRVNEIDDLKEVLDEPTSYYKLFVRQGVHLPIDFVRTHPNVLKILGFNTEAAYTALTDTTLVNSVITSQDGNIHSSLKDYLKTKKYDAAIIKRAIELSKVVRETVG